MVTIQVRKPHRLRCRRVSPIPNSSPEEARRIATYLTTANLTGHDSHGVIRVPVYIRWKKMGSVVPDQTVELVVDTPSLAVVDGKFGYGQTVTPQAVQDRHREMQEGGPCRGGAAQCRPYRPGRRLGRNGGRRRPGVGPFRQRRGLAAGGAVMAASRSGCRPRPIASAFRARARIRSCSISPPRSSPKARCWSQAAAARNCRRAR